MATGSEPDFVPKRRDIATAAVKAATDMSNAYTTLKTCAATLLQTGGNFEDSDFVGTNMAYLSAYNMNVLLTIFLPDYDAFLQTGTPPHDGTLRACKQGP